MYYKIDQQLEYITKYITLNEGELILTGTPHGIGPIQVGDKLYASMSENGSLLMEMNFLVEEDKNFGSAKF